MIRRIANVAAQRFLDIPGVGSTSGLNLLAGSDPSKRRTGSFLRAYAERPWLSGVADKVATDVSCVEWTLHALRAAPDSRAYIHPRALNRADVSRRHAMIRRLRADGELDDIDDHPLLDLLFSQNPVHPGQTGTRLVMLTIDLVGEGFWLIERWRAGPLKGLPKHLWPMSPEWFTGIPSPLSGRDHFVIRFPGGTPTAVPASEVVYVRTANPAHPYSRGVGTSSSLGDELDIDEYASKEIRSRLWNKARPDFLIMSPKISDKATARRLERKWMEKHGSFWNAGLPHFLSFEAKIHQLTSTFEELQLAELRPQQRDAIRQRFGVPPEILGTIENSNRATIDSADYLYQSGCVEPRMEALRQALQIRLAPEYDERLLLDFVSPVPEDRSFKKEVMEAAPWNYTRGEWKELAGIEPQPGDAVYHVPINLIEEPAIGGGVKSIHSGRAHQQLARGKFTDEDPEDRFWIALTKVADRFEPRVRRHFLDAVEHLRQAFDGVSDSIRDLIAVGNIEAAITTIPWATFEGFMAGIEAEVGLEAMLLEAMGQTGTLAAEELSTMLDIDASFDVTNVHAVNAARFESAALITGATARQKDAIRQLIARHVAGGTVADRDVIQEVRESLGLTEQQEKWAESFRQKLVDAGASDEQVATRTSRYRAALERNRGKAIARTETIWAANAGQHESWRQAAENKLLDPAFAERYWVTTPDERLCPICEPVPFMEVNESVGLEDMFTLGDGTLVLYPPAHPLCRCGVGLRIVTEKGKAVTIHLITRATIRLAGEFREFRPVEERAHV